MKKNKISSVEYALQFRFKPNGAWHLDHDTYYDSLAAANTALDLKRETAKNLAEFGEYAQYWRIVKREITNWEEVSENEMQNH